MRKPPQPRENKKRSQLPKALGPADGVLAQVAREQLREGHHEAFLDRLLGRIHFVRNQLVHGGSTYNGQLNRTAVRRASQMMEHLLGCFLQIMMEHAYMDDWGDLCYPPIQER